MTLLSRQDSHLSLSTSRFEIDIAIDENRWEQFFPGEFLENLFTDMVERSCQRVCPWLQNMTISIVLTNDAGIHVLNMQYRGKDAPTNVLSFGHASSPLQPTDIRPGIPFFAGDIIISLDRLLDESHKQAKEPHHHLAHLLVHGFLHLLGYDHVDDRDAEVMENHEIEILGQTGIANPYGEGK